MSTVDFSRVNELAKKYEPVNTLMDRSTGNITCSCHF